MIMGRKAGADGTIDEGLDCGRWRSELVWRKHLTIVITNLYEMRENLFEEPLRRPTGHGCVKAVAVSFVGHTILNLFDQTETPRELESGYRANMRGTLVIELNAKVLLEKIMVRT